MKTLFTFLSIIFLFVSAEAKVVYLNNNLENPNISENLYTTWADAYAAVSSNDTLMVAGSNFSYGRVAVTKPLVVIGPGYFLEENKNTHVDKKEAMFDQFSLSDGAAGTKIKGLSINGSYGMDISDDINDIVIENNFCYSIDFSFGRGGIYNNVAIKKCFVRYGINMDTNYDAIVTNATITNNIMESFKIKDGSSGIIANNIFVGDNLNFGTSSSFEIANNIFLNTNENRFTIQPLPDASVHNNISLTGAFGTDNGNFSAPQSTLFITDQNATTDGKYMLSENSPAKGAGSNGSDIGPFGGLDPYRLSGLPNLPNIYELSTVGLVSGDKLPVTIKIKQ
jgi:hypothetical protein